MNSQNPFSSDDFKKNIMNQQGIKSGEPAEDEFDEFESVEDLENKFSGIIASAPKIPAGVKNVIIDASSLAKNDREKRAENLNLALNDVFSKYNKEYGTSLQLDFKDISRNMVNVADPTSRRVLELYLSEVFQSIRPLMILTMISRLTQAMEFILDPERMFGGELGLADTWVACQKILEMVKQLEDMKEDILIKGSELELKKIGEQINGASVSVGSENADVVDSFMKWFKSDTLEKNESNL